MSFDIGSEIYGFFYINCVHNLCFIVYNTINRQQTITLPPEVIPETVQFLFVPYAVVVLLQANLRQLKSELYYTSEETEEGRAHIQRIKELIHEKTETLHRRLEVDILGQSVIPNEELGAGLTHGGIRNRDPFNMIHQGRWMSLKYGRAMGFPSTEPDTRKAAKVTAPVAESVDECDGLCRDPVFQNFESISSQTSVIASEFEMMFPRESEDIFKGKPSSANSKGSDLHRNLLSQQVRKVTQQSFVKRPRLIIL